MKTLTLFLLLIFASLFFPIDAEEIKQAAIPQLQILKRSEVAPKDSTNDSLKITADSATIISPKIGTIITTDSVPVEIMPRCSVDSMMITVTHTHEITDTIAVLYKSPYKAVWHCAKYPDQDQLHLKFGYILFLSNGKKIVCPPLAHRWVLERSSRQSRKKFHCTFVEPEEITIDGNFSDWKHYSGAKLGDAGVFKCLWTGTHILFYANIQDTSITESDMVELHFDIYRDRAGFSGINHRTVIFMPLARSNCLTVSLNDSGFKLEDSINVLLSREMEWRKEIRPDGYSIETSLPLFALSDMQFAPKEIGFDVSVVNVDRDKPGYRFTDWAGALYSNRYNPGEWGKLVLHQAMFPLRMLMVLGAIFFVILLLVVIVVIFYQSRGIKSFHELEERGFSDEMKKILDIIHSNISDPSFDINKLANILQTDISEIREIIQNETEREFPDYLQFIRIRYSKKLLRDTSLSITDIVEKSGFRDESTFISQFETVSRVSPENFRKRIIEEMEENEDEEEIE
ncbi:MAG: helix-turn-helix domain-containing protein [Fibrobacter sp.]|nr:helix-turn-helix domain-containing protein [Fibrobacter sp.]